MYPALALIVVAACGEGRASTPPAPKVIALGDALRLSITPERCTVTGEAEVEVTRAGLDTVAAMDGVTTLTLRDGNVADADGTRRLRLVDQAGQLAVVTKEGVPVARIFTTEAQANVVDAARAPLLTVTREANQLVVTPSDGASPAVAVTGTDDLTLAAALALPGVPPDVRALLACARALPAPAPAPATASGTDTP